MPGELEVTSWSMAASIESSLGSPNLTSRPSTARQAIPEEVGHSWHKRLIYFSLHYLLSKLSKFSVTATVDTSDYGGSNGAIFMLYNLRCG